MRRHHSMRHGLLNGNRGRWAFVPDVLASFVVLTLAHVPRAACGDQPVELSFPLPPVLKVIEHPRDNPSTPAKIALGRELFHDPRLSRTGRVSCATCHDPAKGYSNGERIALGVDGREGTRNVFDNTLMPPKFKQVVPMAAKTHGRSH